MPRTTNFSCSLDTGNRQMDRKRFRRFMWLGAATLTGSMVAQSAAACPEMRGVELLLGDHGTPRAILLGEIHGTREGPDAVATLVCLAVEANLAVSVALEIPQTEQPRIDAYISRKADSVHLLSGGFWQRDYQDGRSSQAMFALIRSLREIDPVSNDVRILAIDNSKAERGRDSHMAERLAQEAIDSPGRLVIALVGNLHNRLTRGSRWNADYEPMGYLLGKQLSTLGVVSLRLTHRGGDAWICSSGDASECGSRTLSGGDAELGVSLFTEDERIENPYSGEWHLGAIQSSPPAKQSGTPARAEVATTRHFVFYSDLRANLHDELNHFSRLENPPRQSVCLTQISKEDRQAWDGALQFYRERLSGLHLRGAEMSAVRARFLAVEASDHAPLVNEIFTHLEKAVPAHEACFWTDRDRINRAWIASVLPRLREHETAMTVRLSSLFQHTWPASRVPIDVVGWVSDSGANTIDEPAHVMISSGDQSYRGDAAFEMVFHEASHLIIDARYGKVSEELGRANAGRFLPRRDLWHTILFFTVGQVAKERLAEAGAPGYVPYLYAQGLIERGWRVYREPLEKHWQPYVNGEIDLPTAMDRLIAAIHER